MRFHSLEAAIEHAVDHGYRPDDWQILEYLHDEFVDLTKVGAR